MPAANVPLRALDGWGAKNDLLPVELRATFFGIMRFGFCSKILIKYNFGANLEPKNVKNARTTGISRKGDISKAHK